MSSNEKGDRRERELVNELDEAGFAVMRAPASGSATARELPDVLAGDGDAFYAVEAKASAGDPIYLSFEEIEALNFFSDSFGATALVAARFDREDWYFFRPHDLHQTPKGNFRVKKEKALSEGIPLAELAAAEDERSYDVEEVVDAVTREILSIEEAVEMFESADELRAFALALHRAEDE